MRFLCAYFVPRASLFQSLGFPDQFQAVGIIGSVFPVTKPEAQRETERTVRLLEITQLIGA